MILSIDTLGAPKYPKAFLSIPRRYCVRSFATTFGDFEPLARKWVSTGGHYLGVGLLWEDDHKFGDKHIKAIRKLASIYQKIAVQNPGSDIELSTFTEHELSNPDKYHDIAQEAAPSCTIINNPTSKGAMSKRYKNECHGSMGVPNSRYNYSGDGGLDDKPVNAELVDCNIRALLDKHKNCERFYVWHSRNNGHPSLKDKTPRPDRWLWPTKEFLASELYLFTEPGLMDLPHGWIVKSHSEHHGKNETKGDKLLIISPQRNEEIKLKRGGSTIGTLEYYGPYDEGGYRYYSKGFGYKLGANLEVWMHGQKFGTINGGFRYGAYRGKI